MSNKKKTTEILDTVEANCMEMGDKAHKEYMKEGALPVGKFSIAAYRGVIAAKMGKIRLGKS